MPYRKAVIQPLLPYEKRLIDALGCSEEEYRIFAKEVELKTKKRGEEYAHIPDIRCEATTIAIISLVVGLLSTAASILLAPKPRAVGRDREIEQRQLGGRTGRTIFTPNSGFDSAQELAAYGEVVPIVFTRRDEAHGTGGLLISPALVWSRMKSWGGYQIAEIIAVAGQGNMARPELAGIFLGNNALDGIYKSYFDFYWNGGFEVLGAGSHLRMYNHRYGELSIDDGRNNEDHAFYAPTNEGADQPAFSGAFTPTSQTAFGVYSGIPNGTPYRPNWRVISIPDNFDEKQRRQAKNQQKKYVDQYLMEEHPYGGESDDEKGGATEAGMPGTGTNYARRIGIIEHRPVGGGINTVNHTLVGTKKGFESWGNLTQEFDVNVGDTIVILFGKGRQTKQPFPVGKGIEDVNLSDIRSQIEAESSRYDQLLSMGSTFMIGRSTWQVINRPNERYDPEIHTVDGYRVTLRCLEAWSNLQRKIGVVDEDAITVADYLPYSDIEESYYPILKYEIGTFQNTRACDVTEIGIKSQVWAKFNGITNFNTLLAPGIMYQNNQDNIQVTEGKLTAYARRMSFFALDVRLSNYDENATSNEGWTNIGPYLFAVIGDSPVDIYSFIRVTHPARSQYEYRLRPFNSAIPSQQSSGDVDVFVLDGSKTPARGWSFDTYLGTFNIGARGYFAKPRDYFTHLEMAVVPELIQDDEGQTNLVYGRFVDDDTKLLVTFLGATANESGPTYNVGDPLRPNTLSNILSVAAGLDPYFNNLGEGARTTIPWEYSRDAGREVYMELRLVSYRDDSYNTPRNYWWRIESTTVTSFNGEWNNGDTFAKYSRNTNGIQFAFFYETRHPQVYEEFDAPQTATRLFQRYSGIAEVSHYGDLISRSCDDSPEHELIYVNECLSESNEVDYAGCAIAGLKLKSSDNFTQIDQLRCFLKNGLEVERLLDNDTAPSNLLTDLVWYLATNKDTGAGSVINSALIDRDALVITGRYLRANRLFYDDVIAEPVNLRTWLADKAASMLCFTSLKNGKLALEPALPYFDDGVIDEVRPVTISAMFTEGNMIEDSLEISWLELEERKLFQAVIIYRKSRVNQFPEQRSLIARYNTGDKGDLPIEEFTFEHITSDEHAMRVARYFLAIRKHQTHTITFKTLPWGLSLAPGQFIRVASELSPYRPTNNGIIKSDGTIVAINALTDGNYEVYYWDRQSATVEEGTLQVSNGAATEFFNTVFAIKTEATLESQVYQIEALDVDQEGIVTIKASNYAVDSEGRSLLAIDTLDAAGTIEIIGSVD